MPQLLAHKNQPRTWSFEGSPYLFDYIDKILPIIYAEIENGQPVRAGDLMKYFSTDIRERSRSRGNISQLGSEFFNLLTDLGIVEKDMSRQGRSRDVKLTKIGNKLAKMLADAKNSSNNQKKNLEYNAYRLMHKIFIDNNYWYRVLVKVIQDQKIEEITVKELKERYFQETEKIYGVHLGDLHTFKYIIALAKNAKFIKVKKSETSNEEVCEVNTRYLMTLDKQKLINEIRNYLRMLETKRSKTKNLIDYLWENRSKFYFLYNAEGFEYDETFELDYEGLWEKIKTICEEGELKHEIKFLPGLPYGTIGYSHAVIELIDKE